MSYEGHRHPKPRPIMSTRPYPPMPYIPIKIRGSHVPTPAAREGEFVAPSFRGPNDPRPPVHVGTPHQSETIYEQQRGGDANANANANTNGTGNSSRDNNKKQVTSELPSSFKLPTVKRTTPRPVSSPAANTFRGAPILSRTSTATSPASRYPPPPQRQQQTAIPPPPTTSSLNYSN